MNGKNKENVYRWLSFLVMIISVLIFFTPNFNSGMIAGSDSPFHMARIESLALAIHRGEFPVKIHMDLAYGYGYGAGFFYSDFFLYIPAILMNLGVDIQLAYKIFAALIAFGVWGAMYWSIYKLTSCYGVAAVCSVLYLFSTVVEESVYVHFAIGRSTALIFMPMAIIGIYLWAYREENTNMFAMGFVGLLFSHVLSTILSTIICGLIAILYASKWIKNPQKWKQMFAAVGIVLMLTACYWLPLLQQWRAQTYRASEPWTWVDENVLPFSSLFTWNSIGIVLSYIGVLTGIYLIVRLFTGQTLSGVWRLYIMGVGLTLLPCIRVFWEKTRLIFKFLQFPNRVLMPATILIIMSFALVIKDIFSMKKKYIVTGTGFIVCIAIIICVLLGYKDVNNNEDFREDYRGRQPHTEIAGLGAGEEWLPLETTRERLTDSLMTYDAQGNAIIGDKITGEYYYISNGSEYYIIPYIWYLGYEAQDETLGINYQVEKNLEDGMVRVLTHGESGTQIRVWYRGTKLQVISYVISLLGFFIILYRFVVKRIGAHVRSK